LKEQIQRITFNNIIYEYTLCNFKTSRFGSNLPIMVYSREEKKTNETIVKFGFTQYEEESI